MFISGLIFWIIVLFVHANPNIDEGEVLLNVLVIGKILMYIVSVIMIITMIFS